MLVPGPLQTPTTNTGTAVPVRRRGRCGGTATCRTAAGTVRSGSISFSSSTRARPSLRTHPTLRPALRPQPRASRACPRRTARALRLGRVRPGRAVGAAGSRSGAAGARCAAVTSRRCAVGHRRRATRRPRRSRTGPDTIRHRVAGDGVRDARCARVAVGVHRQRRRRPGRPSPGPARARAAGRRRRPRSAPARSAAGRRPTGARRATFQASHSTGLLTGPSRPIAASPLPRSVRVRGPAARSARRRAGRAPGAAPARRGPRRG